MPVLKFVTINIFSDQTHWHQRRELLVNELISLKPDFVALQEVRLPENPAQWIADQLGFESIFICPQTGGGRIKEGIALISSHKYRDTMTLDLEEQGRVAQAVLFDFEGHPMMVVNGHFLWQPGESNARLCQIERLIEWLKGIPGDPLCLIGGDFNGTPDTKAIKRMHEEYDSAFAAIHKQEPDYTTPTPLPRSFFLLFRTFLKFIRYIRLKEISLNWRGTLDYIFVDPRLKVIDSRIVFTKPDPVNEKIYASDHFGIFAEVEIANTR
jgi:endonuclease/exonuclease/phosphatase family metal-dependent hydrolase